MNLTQKLIEEAIDRREKEKDKLAEEVKEAIFKKIEQGEYKKSQPNGIYLNLNDNSQYYTLGSEKLKQIADDLSNDEVYVIIKDVP